MPAASKKPSAPERESGKAYFRDFILKSAPFLSRLVILFIGATLRTDIAGGENLKKALESRGNVIYAFWHNMMLPMTFMLRNKGINIMVSRSRDGEIISKTVKRFGGSPVRGSTSRQGSRALVKMIGRIKKGEDAAITPDGPRGPAFRAQPGAAYLAAKTSRPVVPAAFSSSMKFTLKSWDCFMIPFPFSRSAMVYGRPVYVSEKDDIEEKSLEIENNLKEAVEAAEAITSRANKGEDRWT